MTIVAAVKSRDGLVIGTDSMTQVTQVNPANPQQGLQFLKSYANATKLFRIAGGIAVATWGSGNIGDRSISGIVRDFEDSVGTSVPASIDAAANQLCQHVASIYDGAFSALPQTQQPVLGFLVGGYSQGQGLAELWEVRFPVGANNTRVNCVRGQQQYGANWRGIELPFTRLHFGFDTRIGDKLVAAGVDKTVVQESLGGFETPVVFDSMPVQDAIDYAKFILRTTIGFTTFEIGVPTCGEPLQLAVMLRNRGFEWIEEPRFHV
jgi:hypothetical protein